MASPTPVAGDPGQLGTELRVGECPAGPDFRLTSRGRARRREARGLGQLKVEAGRARGVPATRGKDADTAHVY